jgi:hypothetical protein
LKFSTYNLPTARIFDVLVKALYVSATFRTNTYMLCAFGQCGVLGYPYGTTTSMPTKMARNMKERLLGFSRRCHKRSAAPNWQSPPRGLAVSTSGLEII